MKNYKLSAFLYLSLEQFTNSINGAGLYKVPALNPNLLKSIFPFLGFKNNPFDILNLYFTMFRLGLS